MAQLTFPNRLIDEIKDALSAVNYGSVEIYVQDKTVTQITVRNIKKIQKDETKKSTTKNINQDKIRVLTIKQP